MLKGQGQENRKEMLPGEWKIWITAIYGLYLSQETK